MKNADPSPNPQEAASTSDAPPRKAGPPADPALTDEQLWERFARNDCEASFAILYRRYDDPLHAWMRSRGIRDHARAADLVQDVWVRAVANRHSFDPQKRFTTWIFHVAKNLAANEGRRLRRSMIASESDFLLLSDEAAQYRVALSTDLPEAMMNERTLELRLNAILVGLPAEQRRIFELRYMDGRSNEEVAAMLGIEIGSLRGKSKRVRIKVRSLMGGILPTDAPDAGAPPGRGGRAPSDSENDGQ